MNWRKFLSREKFIVLLVVFLFLNFLISLALVYSFLEGVSKESLAAKIPFTLKEEIKSQIRWLEDLPYVFYRFKSDDLPVYNLYIDKKELDELNKNLPAKGGVLSDEYKKYRPAKFVFGDKEYDVEVKYRGFQDDHWLYSKKSWRIKFPKTELFNGMRAISLIIPVDRDFIAESVSNYLAKKLNLLSPFLGFANLKVNGEPHGVYLQYEHWGKEFLEKNSLSGDTNLYGEVSPIPPVFEQTAFWKKYNRDSISTMNNFAEISQLLDLLNNSSDKEFYKNVFNLIDEDNFYNWQIHTVLAGSTHQDNSHNLRLYFNNAIGKFQLIPWDVAIGGWETDMGLSGKMPKAIGYNFLVERILKNPEFLLKRNNLLWEYVKDDSNLKDDLKYFDETHKKIKIATYNDRLKKYPNSFFDERVAEGRALLERHFYNARNYLKDSNLLVDILLNSNEARNGLGFYPVPITLDLYINSFSPLGLNGIEIEKLEPTYNSPLVLYYDKNKNDIFDNNDLFVTSGVFDSNEGKYKFSKFNILLHTEMALLEEQSGYGKTLATKTTKHRFFTVSSANNLPRFDNAEINFKVTNSITKDEVEPKITYIDASTFSHFDQIGESVDSFTARNPIFQKLNNQKIVLYPGSYVIGKDVIVPQNLELEIQPGAVLYFAKDVSFISYSPVKAQGAKLSPIKFLSLNPSQPWGVFAVVDTDKKSEFNYAVFERGSQAYINGIFFSGMLALHKSDVLIKNSEFKYATGDDGLNVKYAAAVVADSLFHQNNFDGLDFDFVRGEISGSQFIDNGNDGVDVSGSNELTIKDNTIKNSTDKCISIGENSNPLILGNFISGCDMGIAVKDLSRPEIKNNEIVENRIGIAAYQKKQIFGGAFPKVWNNEFRNNEKDTETDELSKIE